MIAWAGCVACHQGKTFTGKWIEADDVATYDPEQMHREVWGSSAVGAHLAPLVPFTLETWGIPPRIPEDRLSLTAELLDVLTLHNLEYPAWVMAAWLLDKEVYELTPEVFKAVWAGTWRGKPTRALRKHYRLTRAGQDAYYMWRRA